MKFYFPLLSLLILVGCKETVEDPHDANALVQDFSTYEGLTTTLFASEPMLSNPTNMDIDSKGRIWITEGFNYRHQFNPKNPFREEGDRIVILEDTNGDGKADISKVFYQGPEINAALGICVLGNKVIVSCSPNIYIFTDEDGDDIADKKEILFQGIKGEQHDHAIHAFTFGHDGKLYFNMGNEGIVLIDAKGDTVVDVRGNKLVTNGNPYREGLALRCDIDGSNMEVIGHNFRNNYELVMDPFGTVWQSDNDDDGNKATRINYVMEHGNFGYKDEMSGASWYARRTNMETETPAKHWHLNDPGVVPNVLITGSGSPTGITIYEGTMLPEIFRGKLLHAEPGHNVIRSYQVTDDGAGYAATIVDVLKTNTNQWFRPSDVTVAPDGSVFVADWYDPGVGGHQMGDAERGRVYRIATPKASYKITSPNVSTIDGAIEALLSPNQATRYEGYQTLVNAKEEAAEALLKLWKSDNQRHRAQAFWLLSKTTHAHHVITEALHDDHADIRIQAIRVARAINLPILPIVEKLKNDASPQVRREVAIALRGLGSKEAADVWTTLALQYDGKDRWYLEALGIGALDNEDLYFSTWLSQIGDAWKTESKYQDIVWRSRSKHAIPLLGSLIDATDSAGMYRYFRAFDFHKDPSKQVVLASLIEKSSGEKVMYALKHVDPSKLTMTSGIKKSLDKVLDETKGKIEFVELVRSFKKTDRVSDLRDLALEFSRRDIGRESAKILLDWDKSEMIREILHGKDDEQAHKIIHAIRPYMYHPKAMEMMEVVVLDTTRAFDLRSHAAQAFRGPWEAEDRLLWLAKENKLPEDIHTVVAGVFQNAWRATLRDEVAKYLKLPTTSDGKSLPTISMLIDKNGNAQKGKPVFQQHCANCHQVKKEGVHFGPDLTEIGTKLSKEAMYNAIIFPDQGISFGYEAWRLKLKDGGSAFGRIISETEEKVELQYLTSFQTVAKADIESRTMLTNSLMPSNLQASMSEEDLIDLVEYLMTLKTN
jgi:putative membrane-bound dehydrogenase-like protein